MRSPSPQLLVSVRSLVESEDALAGGADLIDVKEPARGALGRADDDVLRAIVESVAGRRPTSAALGELREFDHPPPAGFDFVKCGLASAPADWRTRWRRFADRVLPARAVFVAYADWQCAEAPALDDVIVFAMESPEPVVLIDTCCKDGRGNLLDWLPEPWLGRIVRDVQQGGGRIALAGSLDLTAIAKVRELQPDWIAVRGAACRSGDRSSEVDRSRVTAVKDAVVGVSVTVCSRVRQNAGEQPGESPHSGEGGDTRIS